MRKYIVVFLVLVFVSACTSKDLYGVGQSYQKSECIRQARTNQEHDDCMYKDQMSYEEYEKERLAVKEAPPSLK